MSFVFKDRKSAYPNRYRVTPEDGSTYYATLERADEPTEVGTPLNAETFNAMFANGAGLPEVTTSDNGKTLRVVDGVWAVVENPQYGGSVKVE